MRVILLSGLDVTLASAGVETVYVSGVATDFCVGYTAVDALSLGLTTFVVEDLIRGVADPGRKGQLPMTEPYTHYGV